MDVVSSSSPTRPPERWTRDDPRSASPSLRVPPHKLFRPLGESLLLGPWYSNRPLHRHSPKLPRACLRFDRIPFEDRRSFRSPVPCRVRPSTEEGGSSISLRIRLRPFLPPGWGRFPQALAPRSSWHRGSRTRGRWWRRAPSPGRWRRCRGPGRRDRGRRSRKAGLSRGASPSGRGLREEGKREEP